MAKVSETAPFKILLEDFLTYVSEDSSWKEPKRVFPSQEDFKQFPFFKEIFTFRDNPIEVHQPGGSYHAKIIETIEEFPRGEGGCNEIHVTIGEFFWDEIQEIREDMPERVQEIPPEQFFAELKVNRIIKVTHKGDEAVYYLDARDELHAVIDLDSRAAILNYAKSRLRNAAGGNSNGK